MLLRQVIVVPLATVMLTGSNFSASVMLASEKLALASDTGVPAAAGAALGLTTWVGWLVGAVAFGDLGGAQAATKGRTARSTLQRKMGRTARHVRPS